MKKRFLAVLSMIFVLGLFGAVFAFNGSANNISSSSCPMQKNTTTQTAQTVNISKVPVVVSDDDCCQPGADCCKGGSCCHKKKK